MTLDELPEVSEATVSTATPPLVLSQGNLALAYEAPFSVKPAAYTSEKPTARLRFWMVRHVNAMSVDNTNVVGMDFTALPINVAIVEWKGGVGEIEYFNLPRLRDNFIDVTPYCPFFQQFMSLLVGITLAQAKKIQCDLIDVLYEAKRQMPYHYAVAAGDYTWDATDDVVAAMSIRTVPTIIGYSTGTSDSTTVGKINALIDQINAWIVNPGNNLTVEIMTTLVNAINAAVNSTVVAGINSYIVNAHNNFISYFNNTVLGTYSGGGSNTINNRLASAAAPNMGLTGDIPHSGDTFGNVGDIDVAAHGGVTVNPFPTFPHQGITPDPSIDPITWAPSGSATEVNLTAVEMGTLMKGIADRRASLLNVRITKKNAVNALTTLSAVIAYDVTAGWPTV